MLMDYKVLGHNLHINCAFGHRLIKAAQGLPRLLAIMRLPKADPSQRPA
jgi:hypothetical protein